MPNTHSGGSQAGSANGYIDFAAFNEAAGRNGRSLVQELIPGGKFRSLDYIVRNATRNDKSEGSLSINYRTGKWYDSVTNEGGEDFISLVAHLRGCDQSDAAHELAAITGIKFIAEAACAAGSTDGSAVPVGALTENEEAAAPSGLDSIDVDAEIARLQALNRIEYERQRALAAEKIGIRVSVLDDIVQPGRKGDVVGQGKAVVAVDVEPWSEPIVDPPALLDGIAKALRAHIVLTREQADTIALWSVYTHGYQVWRIAPRLGIRAPSKGCGKSETMRRLKRLVRRPVSCENLTPAVAFRLIDAEKPTLLLDEMDNMITEDRSQMLGILNSGYERGGQTFRCVGDQSEVRGFSTYCPMAYAMIGSPPGTFDSRTITVAMRRATPNEARELVSMEDGEAEDERFCYLGRKAARWVQDNVQKLAQSRPDMAGLVNRTSDNWRPLFAIADVVGGEWPSRARNAAWALVRHSEAQSPFEDTLAEIQKMFGERDEITSKEIVERLIAIESGPWAEWGKDKKPITQNALARLLKPHKVFPGDIGPERKRLKGYRRAQFDQLFQAYLKDLSLPPPDNRASAQNGNKAEVFGNEQARSTSPTCADDKSEKPSDGGNLRGCAVSESGNPEKGDDTEIPNFCDAPQHLS